MRSEEKRLKKEEKERMRLQRKERMRGQEERQREAAAGQAKDDGRVSLDHAHANPTPAGKAKSAKGKSGNGHAVTSAVASWRKQGGGNVSEAVARSCRGVQRTVLCVFDAFAPVGIFFALSLSLALLPPPAAFDPLL